GDGRRAGLGHRVDRCDPRGARAREPLPDVRARAQHARRTSLRARGLGGGDPPRGRGRRARGAAGEPDDPARSAPAGHGAGARRRAGHEGARGPHDIGTLAWAAGALIILGASFVMGLAGFGIGLVSLAFLPYLMAPAEAIVLMTLATVLARTASTTASAGSSGWPW